MDETIFRQFGGYKKVNLEEKFNDLIQKKIINDISKQDFIKINYDNRYEVPYEVLKECYEKIDIEKVKEKIISRLEEEMADKIVNKMVTEFSNDIKQIMCNRELREDLRYYMRTKIEEINDKVMIQHHMKQTFQRGCENNV